MSDLADTREPKRSRSRTRRRRRAADRTSTTSLSVAIIATFIALCNVKAGNVTQAMQQAQANSVDAWAYFQAKGTKLNIAESARDGGGSRSARSLGASLSAEARALIDKKVAERRGEDLACTSRRRARSSSPRRASRRNTRRLNVRDDQFDMAEAFDVGRDRAAGDHRAHLASAGCCTSAGRSPGFGILSWGLPARRVWNLHPDFLARLLG